MQRDAIEPPLNAMRGDMRRHRAIGGKQGHLGRPLCRLVERLDDPAPRRPLAIVDLPQIEHLPLHHLAPGAALTLYNVPVDMLFAVFASPVPLQVHAAASTAGPAGSNCPALEYTRFHTLTPLSYMPFSSLNPIQH